MSKITKLRPSSYLIGFSLILLVFTLAQNEQIFQLAEAQEEQKTIDEPLVYEVQITLMDISDVDYANGGYSFSFWITLSSDEIDFSTTPPPVIDFVNGKINDIDHEYVKGSTYSAKVHGTFFTNMEFQNYPLMELKLPIIIEAEQQEADEIKFVQDVTPSDIDRNLTISGLIFKNTEIDESDYTYLDGGVFSRYSVTYNFTTPFLASFMIGIFPILVMGAVVLLSFLLEPTLEIRPEIVTATLIAAVFFHVIDVGESLPPLEYLTLEDKLMTTLYALIIFAMVEIAVQRKFNEDDMEKAVSINKKFRLTIPVLIIGTFGLVWLL